MKLFVAALWSDAAALQQAVARMKDRWGDIDFEGPDHPFTVTDYYESEMGKGLQRRLLSFERLIPPEELVEVKLFTNEVEEALRGPAGRLVNLDAGTLDHNKVVLASAKAAGQKIHLGRGIYADLMLRYGHGRLEAFPWTFPDFRDGRYEAEFLAVRRLYLAQLRGLRQVMGPQTPE